MESSVGRVRGTQGVRKGLRRRADSWRRRITPTPRRRASRCAALRSDWCELPTRFGYLLELTPTCRYSRRLRNKERRERKKKLSKRPFPRAKPDLRASAPERMRTKKRFRPPK